MRHLLTTLAALLALWLPATHSAAQAQAQPTARVIVKFKADSALLRRQAQSAAEHHSDRAQALGAKLGLALRSGAGVAERTQVVLAGGLSSEQLAARLAADADVEYAVVDQRRRPFAAPNDPRYLTVGGTGPAAGQWYLRPPTSTFVSAIDAETAWDVSTGSSSVVVAVIDTGVRFDHADLVGRLLPGYDFIADVPTANDSDERDADASDPGDWITQAEDQQAGGPFEGCGAADSLWHGTQVSGLIGAATDNADGMASVGRNVMVLPVRVLGKCGGFDSDIIAGMRWAAGLNVPGVPANPVANRAKVLNLSLGGPGACAQSYVDAVAAINAAGAVVVASAGNSAGHAVHTPANCPGVIAVAALRNVGTKVGFSDIGPEVAVSAPGGNCVNIGANEPCLYPILTATNAGTTTPVAGSSAYTDSFNSTFGTSFSAPLVAGTAGLMLSVQPALTPTNTRDVLQCTARAFPTTGGASGSVTQCRAPSATVQFECYCTTSTCGAGMLNAAAAVRAATPASGPTVVIEASAANAPVGTAVTLDGSASQPPAGRTITGFQWAATGGNLVVAAGGMTATLTPTAIGSVTVSLTVTDSASAQTSASAVVTTGSPPVARISPSTASVVAGESLVLDGSASSHSGGQFQWAITTGAPIASFSGATNGTSATLLPTGVGTVVVRLAVTDATGFTSEASSTIPVTAPPPSGGGALGLPWLLGLVLAVLALGARRGTAGRSRRQSPLA